MKELLITSSLLIVSVLLLRLLFRRRISRRVQYALWLVVAARLLIPVNLPAADFSALSATSTARESVAAEMENRTVYVMPVNRTPAEEVPAAEETQPGQEIQDNASFGYPVLSEDGQTVTRYADRMTVAEILTLVWQGGMVLFGVFFLLSNLLFYRRLRKTRRPYAADCALPCYLVESGLPSPCLFGLFRPAIYLTPASCTAPERLSHVLAHETTHYRHKDHLWAVLRCLCLTVYWFDPLVWIAAAASRTDCELACDEAAIHSLGEDQRLSYGQTLLSLIPVKPLSSGLLRTATTMTSGKRQLRDRIQRIAKAPRTVAAALVAVVVLIGAVCAFTFTGGKNAARPLTEDELAWFNESYFNTGARFSPNQFLTSLYDAPEEIDLFQLFYNGTGLPEGIDAAQQQAVAAAMGSDAVLQTDLIKCSAANMDAVLEDYTGLSLQETHQVGLDSFTYLSDYDAYFHFHGDTNAPEPFTFSYGEQEGDLVRLYYDAAGRYIEGDFTDSWACVTLRSAGNSYQFVSHVLCDPPESLSTAPAGEPWMTIPVEEPEPYTPEPVTVVRRSGDCEEILANCPVGDDRSAVVYRSTDGSIYAACIDNAFLIDTDGWTADCFLTIEYDVFDGGLLLEPYTRILGCDGFRLRYPLYMGTYQDAFYTLQEDGTPRLLFASTGGPCPHDVTGDSQRELIYTALGAEEGRDGTYLVYDGGDGSLFQINLTRLITEHWPEVQYLEIYNLESHPHYLEVWATVPFPGHEEGTPATAYRMLTFDGTQLLLYRKDDTYTDHVADSIQVPEPVLAAVKVEAQAYFASMQDQPMAWDEDYEAIDQSAMWDDYRITSITLADRAATYPQLQIEIYSWGCGLHTSIPEQVTLAGSAYVDEEGWYYGGGPLPSPYLVFQVQPDGSYKILENDLPFDASPESNFFQAYVAEILLRNDLLQPSEVTAKDLYYLFYCNQSTFLNLIGTYEASEQAAAIDALVHYEAGADADLLPQGLQNLEWNSSALTEEGQAAYERLKEAVKSGETTVPSSESPEDQQQAISAAVSSYLGGWRASPACFYLGIRSISVDPPVGSTATATAVWDMVFDANGAEAFLPATGLNNGTNAYRFSLQRNGASGSWSVVTLSGCAVPEDMGEVALSRSDLTEPEDPIVTSFDSYDEAYAACVTDRAAAAGNMFYLDKELSGNGFTVLSWSYRGTPEGTSAAVEVLYDDGTVITLPLPPRGEFGVSDPPESLTLQGNTLTYQYTFTEDFASYYGVHRHMAGTYHYTFDTASRTLTLSIAA